MGENLITNEFIIIITKQEKMCMVGAPTTGGNYGKMRTT